MGFDIVSAKQVDFSVFLGTFNAAYADYFVHIQLDWRTMQKLITRDAIDLDASRVALVDDQAAGVGMLAIEGDHGWIGGLGVLPAFRRHGLGRLIMRDLLAEARSKGLKQVDLEVLQQNTGAISLYQSLGFHQTRRLFVVECPPHKSPAIDLQPFEINEVEVDEALRFYADFHRSRNPWQRRQKALAALDMEGWIILRNGIEVAYCMGWLADYDIRFMDIGMREGEEKALETLLSYVHALQPQTPASLINFPEDEPAWGVLQKLGYVIKDIQFEMRIDLTSP